MAGTTNTQGAYAVDPYAGAGRTQPASSYPDTPEPPRAGVSGFVNILGAAMSMALLVGIGVWGYRLLARDVSGLPVVRAVEGPMRVQPDDPGGQPADHQGLAVNDVAARGSAAPTPDRLVLAPQPVALVDEDTAGPATARAASARAAGAADGQGEPLSPEVAALVAQLTDDGRSAAAAEAGDVASAGNEPQQVALVAPNVSKDHQPETLTDPEDEATIKPDPDAAPVVDGPGLARSLRPVARPPRALGPGQGDAEAAPASLDVNPADLPAGTRLAQLGAYDSAEVARLEWNKLHARFIDYMDGKQRVIQQATSGGRTFYRLRAMGFDDLSDARRFCAVLVAEKADCIPVTTR